MDKRALYTAIEQGLASGKTRMQLARELGYSPQRIGQIAAILGLPPSPNDHSAAKEKALADPEKKALLSRAGQGAP